MLRPKLKIGAAKLLVACPRSLRAFLYMLNQFDRAIDIPINIKGIKRDAIAINLHGDAGDITNYTLYIYVDQ
jgi:hypothetical protein